MTDTPGDDSGDGRSGRQSKIAKLIETYDLRGLGDELEMLWTQEGDDRSSLRELAKYVNERLLTEALQEAAGEALEGEAANYYRLLTSDDVSSGTRIEAENRLRRHGIDVERLRSDFVSRQAIHTYLTSERDASYEPGVKVDSDRVDNRIQTIQRLKNRLRAIAERTLSELERWDRVSVGNSDVMVLVLVQCTECGTQYSITELVDEGSCDCRESE